MTQQPLTGIGKKRERGYKVREKDGPRAKKEKGLHTRSQVICYISERRKINILAMFFQPTHHPSSSLVAKSTREASLGHAIPSTVTVCA